MATFRSLGIRLVATFHSTWLPEDICALAREKGFSGPIARGIQGYYRFLVHMFCRTLDCVSICTAGEISASAEEFNKAYAVPNRKVVLEPHPCEYCPTSREAQEAAKRELGIAERRLLLALGFVRPDKGFHVLLESASVLLKQFPDLVVCVAGNPGRDLDKEYAQHLVDLRNKTGASDRVILDMRYLSAEEFSRYLDAAEIVVVPYLRSVGPSGPIHFALGRGKPVVATDIGHNRSLRNGCLLVPPGDAAALAEVLFRLLSNPLGAQELGTRAAAHAAAHTWDHLAASYLRYYERLLTLRWDVEEAELRVLGPELKMKSSKQKPVATQT
jgi:glycosyltransferase involved in cell wall biosynthesis